MADDIYLNLLTDIQSGVKDLNTKVGIQNGRITKLEFKDALREQREALEAQQREEREQAASEGEEHVRTRWDRVVLVVASVGSAFVGALASHIFG